jgi:phosphatidylglycerol:prolipoprotein diacylglycerol transferase
VLRTLSIAGLSVPAKPILVLVALYAGLWLAARQARARGLEGEHLWNAGFVAAGVTLIAARLWYVVQYWQIYVQEPLQILSPRPGTLAWTPGLVIGLLAGIGYLVRMRVPLAVAADCLAPGVLLGLAILSVGDFLAGDAFGAPTAVPWAVDLWGARRHPVQLYQAAALAVSVGIVLADRSPRDGHRAWLALLLYALTRLVFDAFRGDSLILAGGFRAEQIVAWVVVAVAAWVLWVRRPPANSVHESANA